jgi:hypothetical protein
MPLNCEQPRRRSTCTDAQSASDVDDTGPEVENMEEAEEEEEKQQEVGGGGGGGGGGGRGGVPVHCKHTDVDDTGPGHVQQGYLSGLACDSHCIRAAASLFICMSSTVAGTCVPGFGASSLEEVSPALIGCAGSL